jgi:drug/metabolite transporter (DMT)-like permease
MTPIWMALIGWARPGGERPTRTVIAGLLLGFLGVVLLIGPSNLTGNGDIDPVRAGMVLFGSLCWASGSLYSRRANLPANPLMATAIEMLGGAVLLLAAGLLTGEASGFSASAISITSGLALVYLIIFGSLIAFTAYIWLLQTSSPSKVSTYAYVNPVVAVLLGWGLAGEDLTPRMLLAAAVIVGAVVAITYRPAARGPIGEDEDGPSLAEGSRPGGIVAADDAG